MTRICVPNRGLQHGDFGVEMLSVAEIDTDDRIVGHIMFDPDDIDAAIAELDARYLAGEASPTRTHGRQCARACAAFNQARTAATTHGFGVYRPSTVLTVDALICPHTFA